MTFVLLGLGSNKSFGDRNPVQLLGYACRLLKKNLSDFDYSSVYSSKPMYVENQEDFFNMAACGFVDENVCSAFDFLDEIHRIESELGRDRNKEMRNGPRSIDIDVELWGNESINYMDEAEPMKNLIVPHPRFAEREFVLIPALEILPESADSKWRKLFSEALKNLENQGVKKILDKSEFLKNLTR